MTTQPSSGDLKKLQQEHSPSPPSSLLERRQNLQPQHNEEMLNATSISPMPTGAERMAALRDLGATFEEGQKSIAKVATPTETIVPSFVDSEHLENILHTKENTGLKDTCKEVAK